MVNVLFPRETGRLIAQTSKDVTINEEGIKKIAELLISEAQKGNFGVNSWNDHELNPTSADQAAIDWVFFSDILNFSFWADDDTKTYSVTFEGKQYTGYWSLCAAMNRALNEGIPVTDPEYYASLSLADFKKIFRSDSGAVIPILESRHAALTECGKILIKKYNGTFANCLKEAAGSAQKLLQLVVAEFPCFRDEATYNEKRVGFYKRAQILVADIWAACQETGLGEFHDIDTITSFPDYRIPQVLAYYGALKYSNSLLDQLLKDNLLKNGSRLEVEIRGCTIWAVELISEEVKRLAALNDDLKVKAIPCNPIRVDYFLWDHRRQFQKEMESAPYHKTRSIYY